METLNNILCQNSELILKNWQNHTGLFFDSPCTHYSQLSSVAFKPTLTSLYQQLCGKRWDKQTLQDVVVSQSIPRFLMLTAVYTFLKLPQFFVISCLWHSFYLTVCSTSTILYFTQICNLTKFSCHKFQYDIFCIM